MVFLIVGVIICCISLCLSAFIALMVFASKDNFESIDDNKSCKEKKEETKDKEVEKKDLLDNESYDESYPMSVSFNSKQ